MNDIQTIATIIMALIIGFVFGRSSKEKNEARHGYLTQEEQAMLNPEPKYSSEFDDVHEDVLDAIKAGRTIHAIKIYRDLHGTNLKDAKNFVEAIKRRFKQH